MWVSPLQHLNVLVTGQCNLRCSFCNIGAQSAEVQGLEANLTLELFQKNLLGPNLLPSVTSAHLSGGEPFLRKDLVDLCDLFAVRCPNAELSLVTNGVLTDRVIAFGQEISQRDYRHRFGIGVSLDGIGETHDRIRGVHGAFRHARETIQKLKQYFPGILRSIGFTVIPENIEDLPKVHRLAKENDLDFYFRPAQESPIYYGDNRGKLPLWDEAKLAELEGVIHGLYPLPIAGTNGAGRRSFFLRNMGCALRIKKRYFDCFAGLCSLFIDFHGYIRPCVMLDMTLGNIGRDNVWDALKSTKADQARRYIAQRRCFCWVECETLNSWSTASWLGMPLGGDLQGYEQGESSPGFKKSLPEIGKGLA